MADFLCYLILGTDCDGNPYTPFSTVVLDQNCFMNFH